MAIQTSWHFLCYFGYYDQRKIQQLYYILIFLFVIILFHLLTHHVIQSQNLISQIVEKYQRTLQWLHPHCIFAIHLLVKPPH